jgi:hypothetical protein
MYKVIFKAVIPVVRWAGQSDSRVDSQRESSLLLDSGYPIKDFRYDNDKNKKSSLCTETT